MANIELINLVTTELVQRKKMVEYSLRTQTNGIDAKPNEVLESLREYNQILSDIKLWESLINEITPPDNDNQQENNN